MTTNEYVLARVAKLYYLLDRTQGQIAAELTLSRSKVSRLLAEAKERGIVEVRLNRALERCSEMEERLLSQFGLVEAVVVGSGDMPADEVRIAAAQVAGHLLARAIRPGDVVCVGAGEMVSLTVRELSPLHGEQVEVVQTGFSMGVGAEDSWPLDPKELAVQLARKLGGQARLLPAPMVVGGREIRDALLRDGTIAGILSLAKGARLALTGIGVTSHMSERTLSLRLTEAEMQLLAEQGAVGDIGVRFFDLDGRPCRVPTIDERRIGLELADLRQIPLVIGVAIGTAKAKGILGALRGGYVKALVTDVEAATAVLELAGNPVGRKGNGI